MMTTLKAWISAARPRTLPLSVAGILTGTGFALREDQFHPTIFIFALLTTLGFQILSNFANDYGDGIKGTDNPDRLGPQRALQSGAITDKALKRGIILTSILTLGFVLILVFSAFDADEVGYVLLFLVLGVASIAAAIKYTVGKTAYGYHGLGDVFVFLFFGLLGVVGSYFLYSHHLNAPVWILGAIIGLLSVTVLNLNNMRDINSDKNAGKLTLAVNLGIKKAKRYHYALVLLAFILTLVYIFIEKNNWNLLMLLPFLPLGLHLFKVLNIKKPQHLDPEMKKVALSTVIFALIYLLTGL